MGYTFQYVIAEQLADIGNTSNPNTFFFGLDKVFQALQSTAAKDLPFFLTFNNVSELTSSQFFADAVGTVSTSGAVSLAVATLQSQVSSDPAFTQLDKWRDMWILGNVYHINVNITGGAPTNTYSYLLKPLTHASITVKSHGSGGWTFSGNKIQIVLTGLSAPDGNLFSSNATLSFIGGSDSATSMFHGEYTATNRTDRNAV